MADIKLLMPNKSSGNLQNDFDDLKNRFISVIKELEYVLNNLDEENVARAGSVMAQNIDTKNAKITNAQIKSLSADKLTAGTIDANEIDVLNLSANNITSGTINTENITISSGDESLIISDGLITLFDVNNVERLIMGLDTRGVVDGHTNPYYNKFYFSIKNKAGKSTIYFDDNGDAVFSGTIDTSRDINIGSQLSINNVDISGGICFKLSDGTDIANIMIERMEDINGESGYGVYLSSEFGVFANGGRIATEQYVQDMISTLTIGGE